MTYHTSFALRSTVFEVWSSCSASLGKSDSERRTYLLPASGMHLLRVDHRFRLFHTELLKVLHNFPSMSSTAIREASHSPCPTHFPRFLFLQIALSFNILVGASTACDGDMSEGRNGTCERGDEAIEFEGACPVVYGSTERGYGVNLATDDHTDVRQMQAFQPAQ